jgi:hypothetical protein
MPYAPQLVLGYDPPTSAARCTDVIAHDIVVDRVAGNVFFIKGVQWVAITGSDFGPNYDAPGTSHMSPCSDGSGAEVQADHVLLDAVRVHDLHQTVVQNGTNCENDPAQYYCNHMEGVHLEGASHVTIRRSRFENLAQFDLSVQPEGGGTIGGLTLENDVFDAPCSHPDASDVCGAINAVALQCYGNQAGFTAPTLVRFNSMEELAIQGDGTCTGLFGVDVTGNILVGAYSQFVCDSGWKPTGVTGGYNVQRAGGGNPGWACLPGDVVAIRAGRTPRRTTSRWAPIRRRAVSCRSRRGFPPAILPTIPVRNLRGPASAMQARSSGLKVSLRRARLPRVDNSSVSPIAAPATLVRPLHEQIDHRP